MSIIVKTKTKEKSTVVQYRYEKVGSGFRVNYPEGYITLRPNGNEWESQLSIKGFEMSFKKATIEEAFRLADDWLYQKDRLLWSKTVRNVLIDFMNPEISHMEWRYNEPF